jgi:hypothetical protein
MTVSEPATVNRLTTSAESRWLFLLCDVFIHAPPCIELI